MNGPIFAIFIAILIGGGGGGVRAAASKCVGTIAFSSHGVQRVHGTGLINYKTDHFSNPFEGWDRGTGAFTVVCAGVYHISFAGYGEPTMKLTLKKRPKTGSSQWQEIITTQSGGGSVSVIVPLSIGDQVAVVVTGNGRLQTDSNGTPSAYFNGFRIGE